MRTVLLVVALSLATICPLLSAQSTDKRLMGNVEYELALRAIENATPQWKQELKQIDPAKFPQMSYSHGKSLEGDRNMALLEASNVEFELDKLKTKHTVSRELALHSFLDSLFNAWLSILADEDFADISIPSLQKIGPQISKFDVSIGNDVFAKVELLEKHQCPL